MTDPRPTRQVVKDWSDSVRERVDNLCAIYKCDDIHEAMGVIMTADSLVMGMYKMLVHATRVAGDLDPETSHMREFVEGKLGDMVSHSLSHIADQAISLLCVTDKDALVDDLLAIVQTRYDLEETLGAREDDDASDD